MPTSSLGVRGATSACRKIRSPRRRAQGFYRAFTAQPVADVCRPSGRAGSTEGTLTAAIARGLQADRAGKGAISPLRFRGASCPELPRTIDAKMAFACRLGRLTATPAPMQPRRPPVRFLDDGQAAGSPRTCRRGRPSVSRSSSGCVWRYVRRCAQMGAGQSPCGGLLSMPCRIRRGP